MLIRTFHPRQFLAQVYGTAPFLQYCQDRDIAFAQVPGWLMNRDDYARWLEAIAALPPPMQARIELELAQVNELAHSEAVSRLFAAADRDALPSDGIPADAAVALWFFLHSPALFHDVLLNQEIAETGCWRIAAVPRDIALVDLAGCTEALGRSLQEFFRFHEGTGRFCAVEAYRTGESTCFVAYLSDRLRLLEIFTESGQHTRQAARTAFTLCFAYHSADGRLLLKTRHRARDQLLDLCQRFGQAVLGVELDGSCLTSAFSLDRLKQIAQLLPDAEDMELVRVKALHLAYPPQLGRRRVKLETLSGDSQSAILDLLRLHGGGPGVVDQLQVLYAEVQVKLRQNGRSRRCLIRLWPDRTNLNQTPLGQRLQACLARWGIPHV